VSKPSVDQPYTGASNRVLAVAPEPRSSMRLRAWTSPVPGAFPTDGRIARRAPVTRRNRRPALCRPAQLSPGGVLLGSQSLKCVRFNFCLTTANVAATSTASVTLPADTDDDACEKPAARATTDRAGDGPLAMAFWT
jgi:hypothetical protein